MAIRPPGVQRTDQVLKFKNSDVQVFLLLEIRLRPLLLRFRSSVLTKGDEGEWVRQYYLQLLTMKLEQHGTSY